MPLTLTELVLQCDARGNAHDTRRSVCLMSIPRSSLSQQSLSLPTLFGFCNKRTRLAKSATFGVISAAISVFRSRRATDFPHKGGGGAYGPFILDCDCYCCAHLQFVRAALGRRE